MPQPKQSRSNLTKVAPARTAAFQILRRVIEEDAFASVLLAVRESELQTNDRALVHEFVLGVLRNELWLDLLAAHYAKRESSRLDPPVRIALLLGLYQLRFLSRIPASAAVNDSVSLVRRAGHHFAASFVNAVLRRAAREPDYDPLSDVRDPIEKLSYETSHPLWLIQKWVDAFGFSEAEAFARANNEPAPIAFRVVKTRAKTEQIVETLTKSGAPLVPSTVTSGAFRVSGGISAVSRMVREGRIYLQDEASQLVARAVDPQANDRVLDVCAAPGGKTTQLADLARDELFLTASDLHEHRLRAISSTAANQHLRSINLTVLDALRELPFRGEFDRVLVDAPCSGTGTLRHNPEIRRRITAADILELAGMQQRIMKNAAKTVRVGGRLIYSTCSVELEENENVAENFLRTTQNFKSTELNVPTQFKTSAATARTWPHRDGTDGFFMAAFQRSS